jgi:uracil-DNA glycosylase
VNGDGLNSHIEKAVLLEGLRDRIKADHARLKVPSDLWFWPEQEGVMGFLGTARVIVTGSNPSMGRHKTAKTGKHKTDNFFYRCLREEGMENAHLTDLVKIRATRTDVPLLFFNPDILQRHRDYFALEARIMQPAVVIALGDYVLDVLRGWGFVTATGPAQFMFKVPDVGETPVIRTVHPAATRWPARTKERQERFRKDVREARRVLEKAL